VLTAGTVGTAEYCRCGELWGTCRAGCCAVGPVGHCCGFSRQEVGVGLLASSCYIVRLVQRIFF
jgi:hypothetical protein